jgi:Zn-dependent peptidase ImmA (M78 family)
LCRQYRQLEAWTNEPNDKQLPNIDTSTGTFHYPQVEELAKNAHRIMGLGSRPGQSLYTVLEEVYGVKIFHLDLGDAGIAASAVSEDFGQAILLNTRCSRWRRNHDLAHELFHLLTWTRFKHTDASASPTVPEEKYATCFAGNLLLPADVVRPAIAKAADTEGHISFDQLDTIAREFDVSLESLIWRMHFLSNWKSETTLQYVDQAKAFVTATHRGPGEQPRRLPERYRALAIKALRNGDISQGRFATFMNISRSQVDTFMAKDEPEYAKIETSVT